MSTAFDPWALDSFDPFELSEDREEHDSYEDKFKASLVARAKKRTVKPFGENLWMVDGNPKLGDTYDFYKVEWNPIRKRYECDCYSTSYGEARRSRMCSHALAVALWRRSPEGRQTAAFDAWQLVDGAVDITEVGWGIGLELLESDESTTTGATVTSLFPEDAPQELPWHPSQGTERVSSDGSGSEEVEDSGDRRIAVLLPALPDPSDAIFGVPPLPEWVSGFRGHQWDAISEAMEAYANGAQVVWLDAPTGSGKTLIGEAIRRLLKKKANYICSTKTLQDQFMRDFSYANMLKGRANYPTMAYPFPEVTAGDCTKEGTGDEAECMWCPVVQACPYEDAKQKALRGQLAVINTAYLLAECNYIGNLRGRGVGIVDECDVLENELMGFVEFNVSERMLKTLGISEPKKGSHKQTLSQWLEEQLLPKAKESLGNLGFTSVKDIRQRKSLETLIGNALQVRGEIESDNWLRDNEAGPMVLKPIRVSDYGERYLWQHAEKWLCMSATIISPDELSDSLGLTRKWEVVRVPMTFPIENREINVAPVANMANAHKAEAYPQMVRGIEGVLRLHPNDRVLVHTVSYELTRYLLRELSGTGRPILSYANSAERDRVLESFRKTPAAVLLAPSLDRGVDLRGDDCRVVIVAKVPFPYLGDRQVSARMHAEGGQAWYSVQTVRKLVQMTGRGVRSEDDWCVTYILDKQFVSNVWKKSKSLLPQWWKEAVNMAFPVRKILA